MRIEKFWVVRDPSPVSELEDILFESNPVHYASYCLGTGLTHVKGENTTFYTSEAEARRDAMGRLRVESKPGSVYRADPSGAVEKGYSYSRTDRTR